MTTSNEDTLVGEILADAEKKAGRATRKGEREAAQVVERANADAESAVEAALENARKRAERQTAAINTTIDFDARKIQIDTRESAVREVFENAGAQLHNGADDPEMVARLATVAIEAVGGDSFIVELPEQNFRHREVLHKKITAALQRDVRIEFLQKANSATSAGATVFSADRSRMYDNTIEARLARLHDELRRSVAFILYSEEADSK